MSDLIDTTEMYLRTVLELEEEGAVPLRARISERLRQSGPTVSQTVARMERHGLLHVADDRHLELTEEGRRTATRVMRKHRLAECMLVDVIGLAWEQVHTEACRWEHVMSEAVERRLVELLHQPTESPYGNPIPGLAELGGTSPAGPFFDEKLIRLSDLEFSDLSSSDPSPGVVVRRIAEPMQTDTKLMYALRCGGVRPGATVTVTRSPDGVTLDGGLQGQAVELDFHAAAHVYVSEH